MHVMALSFLLSSALLPQHLEVQIRGIQTNREGPLLVLLWNDSKSFPKARLALKTIKATAEAGEKRVVFSNLAAGPHAVAVYHDENRNDKLDFKFLVLPTEGAGFSGEKTPMGPPQFRDYRVEVGPGGGRAEVRVKYP